MNTADRPQARPDVVFRPVAEEWVLYDPETQNLHVLNATAAVVWSCLDGRTDIDSIVGTLGSALDDPPDAEVMAEDVRSVLARFSEDGLLSEETEV